jgi:hypothetical protein
VTCAAAVILAFLAGMDDQAYSQQSSKPPTEKWRPKDGVYASPGKDFEQDCDEAGYIVIDLAEKSVGGNEWNCKVTKFTGTSPEAIKLNLTCNDLNLELSSGVPGETKFKEIMFLDKIDENAISIRKTLNGNSGVRPGKLTIAPSKCSADMSTARQKPFRRQAWRRSCATRGARTSESTLRQVQISASDA